MKFAEQALLRYLDGSNYDLFSIGGEEPRCLNPEQIAHLYVHAAFLSSAMEFVKEQFWLASKEGNHAKQFLRYEDFLSSIFQNELSSISYLEDFVAPKDADGIPQIIENAKKIGKKCLDQILGRTFGDRKKFAIKALQEMSDYFLQEETFQDGKGTGTQHQGPRLYRTFDSFDLVLGLDYSLDVQMKRDDQTKERLYQGSGVNVQSGYSTILLALQNTHLDSDSKVIDLGSGYGRVGLVFALLKPESRFIGYEYVKHRVDAANKTTRDFNLEESLCFITQDLSSADFAIPDADIYYMYDPFSDETYRLVLEQIVELSKHKKITVVTKGNARKWLAELSEKNGWPQEKWIDAGNLCLFQSCA